MAKQRDRRRRRRLIRTLVTLSALLFVILLPLAAAGLYYNSVLNRLSFVRGQTEVYPTPDADSASYFEEAVPDTDDVSQQEYSPSSEIPKIVSVNKAEGEIYKGKNVINILLIGSDYRIPHTSDPGRADVTMLCSLNKKTGSIKLVSFERGIMLDVPGVGQDLLTHSFHWGGAELTTNLLREYFLVDIAGYAHVDFDSFSAVVDAVGGVDITLTNAEANRLKLPTGLNHLDGANALRYCRLRSIDSNWQRIARQRTTVQAILNRVKNMSVRELDQLSQKVLPLIHTDLSKGEITSILMNATKFFGVTAEQMTIPDHNNQYCDFQYEADRLHDFLYN